MLAVPSRPPGFLIIGLQGSRGAGVDDIVYVFLVYSHAIPLGGHQQRKGVVLEQVLDSNSFGVGHLGVVVPAVQALAAQHFLHRLSAPGPGMPAPGGSVGSKDYPRAPAMDGLQGVSQGGGNFPVQRLTDGLVTVVFPVQHLNLQAEFPPVHGDRGN